MHQILYDASRCGSEYIVRKQHSFSLGLSGFPRVGLWEVRLSLQLGYCVLRITGFLCSPLPKTFSQLRRSWGASPVPGARREHVLSVFSREGVYSADFCFCVVLQGDCFCKTNWERTRVAYFFFPSLLLCVLTWVVPNRILSSVFMMRTNFHSTFNLVERERAQGLPPCYINILPGK